MSHLLWWAVGTFGLGAVVLAAVIFVVGWPVVLAFFTQTKVGRFLALVGGLIGAGVLVFLRGRAAGRADRIAEEKAQAKKEVDRAKKESDRIDALPDDEVDAELGKWDRKS